MSYLLFFFVASYTPTLPVTVSITTTSSPVAGEDLVLTCDHGSTAMNPAYQWFDETGALIGSEVTLRLSPLRESDTGEYSCLVTDQTRSLVGCGLTRVDVQGIYTCIQVSSLPETLGEGVDFSNLVDSCSCGIHEKLTFEACHTHLLLL